jgi:hypothetical protein
VRLPQTGDDQAIRLREIERRLAELEARPRTGVIARQTPLTVSSNGGTPWTADATTDHAIPDVAVDATLRYIVRLHTSWVVIGNVRWLVNFHVDGTLIDRLDDLDCFTTGTRNGEINAALEWFPARGIYDVDVRVDEVVDGGSLAFPASATATRQFWIEAAGPL